MTRCAAHRCPEEALPGSQLCRRHLRRLEAGGGLPVAGEPVVGDQSGHGTYGRLEADGYGVLCHECGESFVALGIHAQRVHGLSAAEYRDKHGIEGSLRTPQGTGPRRKPKVCRGCGRTVSIRRKTCDECWAIEVARRAARPLPRPRWRELTPDEGTALVAAEGEQLEELVRALQADRVPSKAIGQVLGLSPHQMVLRYPREEYRRDP